MTLTARKNRLSFPWLVSLTIATTTLLAPDALAADAPAEAPAATPVVAYRVVVDAPSPLNATLERDVGLVRWQALTGMTDDLLGRLATEAIDEARLAAAAEGWFSAAIEVAVDRGTTPPTYTLRVVTGERTCEGSHDARCDRASRHD